MKLCPNCGAKTELAHPLQPDSRYCRECHDRQQREELRALQDEFLRLPIVQHFADRMGRDTPVFECRSPSVSELEQYLYPTYRQQMLDKIREANR